MNILLYILVTGCVLCVGIFIGRASIKIDGLFIVDDNDYATTRWVIDVKDPQSIPNKTNVRLKVQKMTKGDV